MAQNTNDRGFPSLHSVLRMLLSTNTAPSKPGHHDSNEQPEEPEEPPDGVVYIKSPTSAVLRDPMRESLLTRALKSNSPELSPADHPSSSPPYHHHHLPELTTSDGGLPSLSNSPSPPTSSRIRQQQTGESKVEEDLGRKRCISFAGAQAAKKHETSEPPQPPKKKTTISFACPGAAAKEQRPSPPSSRRRPSLKSRPCLSPATFARKPTVDKLPVDEAASRRCHSPAPAPAPAPAPGPVACKSVDKPLDTPTEQPPKEKRGIPTSGLGKFEASEETRFHEFAGSMEEEPEWVRREPEHADKITLNDCLKKEFAIRKLGEEAEEEAEEDEEEDDDDDDDDDDEYVDEMDDDSTIHGFSSDDEGNESDNEAGFAESDDSGDDEKELWVPAVLSRSPGLIRNDAVEGGRRNSGTSVDELGNEPTKPARRPVWVRKHDGQRSKPIKMRPGTPNLPDSTDFVCGTLDEDRPLEAAYKSCIEQRRLSKQIPIPQDIDPSFPTSDLDDGQENSSESGEEEEEEGEEFIHKDEQHHVRGRSGKKGSSSPPPPPPQSTSSPQPQQQQQHESSKRLHSPRHHHHHHKTTSPPPPPRRVRSPPPPPSSRRARSPAVFPIQSPDLGFNISGLVQRPTGIARTKSLPRTPNPFFSEGTPSSSSRRVLERRSSWSREQSGDALHARGPVDIVEGLERKRQKRKEKFWRQHCRKAAKEQKERRPIPGKGAERMKELGLEAAERCRAYGVGQDAQLVISV